MLGNAIALLNLFLFIRNVGTKQSKDEEEEPREYTILGTPKKVSNKTPLDVYDPLESFKFKIGEHVFSIDWIPEDNKIINVYFNMINPKSLYTFVFLFIGSYLLFLGIYTTTISLSIVSAIFIFYFTEVLNNHLESTENAVLSHISSILNFISTNVLYLVVLSILLSLILIFLLHVGKYIVPCLITYLFYITYASFFNNLIYFVLIALILVTYIFISAILNTLMIVLFSLTGSFLFLSCFEVISNYELGILELIGNLASIKEIPTSFNIYILISLLGVLVQVMYIPKS